MGISPWFALIEGFQICRWSGAFVLHCGDDLFIAGVFSAAVAHIVTGLRNSVLLINRCFGTFGLLRRYQEWNPKKVWQWSTVVNTIWAKRIPGTWSWTLWFQGHFWILAPIYPLKSAPCVFLCQAAGTPGFEATLWSELGAGDRSLGFMGIQRYHMNRLCKGHRHGLLFCENLRWFLWHWQGSVWKQSTLDGKIPNQAFLCCLCHVLMMDLILIWYDSRLFVQQKLINFWSPFHRTHGLLAAPWWQGAC